MTNDSVSLDDLTVEELRAKVRTAAIMYRAAQQRHIEEQRRLRGQADQIVEATEASRDKWQGEAIRLRCALDAIANYESFQGGPIAPRSTPTELGMRRIAREALA